MSKPRKFMDTPEVDAALATLAETIEAAARAAGFQYRAIAVVVRTDECTVTCVDGCECGACARAMVGAHSRATLGALPPHGNAYEAVH